MPSVYSIPCECGKVYTEQTGRSKSITDTSICTILRSLVAEHSINLGHQIQLQNTSILAKQSRWMNWVIREVIKIELHPDNMNREDDFSLSWAWKPLIRDLKKRRFLTKESTPSCGP
jgi:hypothetical protein